MGTIYRNDISYGASLRDNSADRYDPSKSYAVGDLCIRQSILYKCIATTSGEWNESAWQMTTIADEMLNKVDDTLLSNPQRLPVTIDTTNVDTANVYVYKLGKFVFVQGVMHLKATGTGMTVATGLPANSISTNAPIAVYASTGTTVATGELGVEGGALKVSCASTLWIKFNFWYL